MLAWNASQQLKLRATRGKTSLRRLEVQSAQANSALCCPQFQLLGRPLSIFVKNASISAR